MLDQNTDRMWYVIGAVLIGAAIIFGMNTLMPNAFASVGDIMVSVTDNLQRQFETYEDVRYNVYTHGDADVDMSRYNSMNEIVINKKNGTDGVYMRVADLDVKPNTTYIMTYSFEKLDGELWGVGGHTDVAYEDNIFYVDGKRMPNKYRSSGAWTDEWSNLINQGGSHDVEVRFTTPDVLIGDTTKFDEYDGRIYIQPNRLDDTPARIRVFDLKIQEVISRSEGD